MIDGVIFNEGFWNNRTDLLSRLTDVVDWDERMKARKTASFGMAYNYSQINYPFQEMLPELKSICTSLKVTLGFEPNNCLINFYEDGTSKMGYHSDQTDILEKGTGVAIVSLGETRILRFRRIADKEDKLDYALNSGSLIYMNQAVQSLWQHSIPKADTVNPRMSLTFRKLINS